jgi:hypothetical protein
MSRLALAGLILREISMTMIFLPPAVLPRKLEQKSIHGKWQGMQKVEVPLS